VGFSCPSESVDYYPESKFEFRNELPRLWEGILLSSEDLSEKAKQTIKAFKELLEKAEESTEKALVRAAPKVQKSVDASLDTAAKGFTATLEAIDGATSREQLELLKAYKKFVSGQVELLDSRIRTLEQKKAKWPPEQAP
jgi:DNA anti-recombination protein RmuC